MNEEQRLDIYSSGDYPADALSNFYPHAFRLDGVACASMEGLLQSLKTRNRARQRRICALSGKEAKNAFRHRPQNLGWRLTGRLYWQGTVLRRHSDEYQRFLDRAYAALSESPDFVAALLASGDATLVHTVGKRDTRKTVLTEYEFVSRLLRCRARIMSR